MNTTNQQMASFKLVHLPTCPTMTIPEEIFEDPFDLEQLGRGAFGCVYKYSDSSGILTFFNRNKKGQ